MNKTEITAWLIKRGCTKTRRFVALLSRKNQHKVFDVASPEFMSVATTTTGRPRKAGTNIARLMPFARSRFGDPLHLSAAIGWHVRGWVDITARRPHHTTPINLVPPSSWARVTLTEAGVAACLEATRRAETRSARKTPTKKTKAKAKTRAKAPGARPLARRASAKRRSEMTSPPSAPAETPLLDWRPPADDAPAACGA